MSMSYRDITSLFNTRFCFLMESQDGDSAHRMHSPDEPGMAMGRMLLATTFVDMLNPTGIDICS